MKDPSPRVPRDAHGRDDDEDALLAAVRSGEVGAYAELYRRHRVEALRLARRLGGAHDPDDIAQEAFLKILKSILRGGGPHEGFARYLMRVVRNEAVDRARRDHEDAVEDIELAAPDSFFASDGVDELFDSRFVRSAYAGLPEEWQRILWLTEVEGQTPRELASQLGRSPNAISQLSRRAREGLRAAWLEAHVDQNSARPECRSTVKHLGAYERGRLSESGAEAVEEHLRGCTRCAAALAELRELSGALRGVLLPVVLGAPLLLERLAPVMAAVGSAASPELGAQGNGTGADGSAPATPGGADASQLSLLGGGGRGTLLAMKTASGAHSGALITLTGSVALAVGSLMVLAPSDEDSDARTVQVTPGHVEESDGTAPPARTPSALPSASSVAEPSATAGAAQEPSATGAPSESEGTADTARPQEPSASIVAEEESAPGADEDATPLFVPLAGESAPEDPNALAPTMPPSEEAGSAQPEASEPPEPPSVRPEPPHATDSPAPSPQPTPEEEPPPTEDPTSVPSEAPSPTETSETSTEGVQDRFTVDFPPGGDVVLPRPVEGTGVPGAEVRVRDGSGRQLGTTTVGSDGAWALTPAPGAPDVPAVYRVDHVIDGVIDETVKGPEHYTHLAPEIVHPRDGESVPGASDGASDTRWTVLAYRLGTDQDYAVTLDGRRWDLPGRPPGSAVYHLVALPRGSHTLELAYRDPRSGELGARRTVTFTVR